MSNNSYLFPFKVVSCINEVKKTQRKTLFFVFNFFFFNSMLVFISIKEVTFSNNQGIVDFGSRHAKSTEMGPFGTVL